MQICEAFYEVTMKFGEIFGTPLPQKILELGSPDREWGVRLNPTESEIDGIKPFNLHVTWGGFPAGIIDAGGGVIAAGEAANEDTFIEWIHSLQKPGG